MKRFSALLLLGGLIANMATPAYGYQLIESPKTFEANGCTIPEISARPSSEGSSVKSVIDSNDVQPEETAYGIKYEDGVLSMTWYNVCSPCSGKYSNVVCEGLSDGRYDFYLSYDYEDPFFWSWPETDCMCFYDVKATYDNFAPGTYCFCLDYVYYDVELAEGLDVILRPKDASKNWVYSDLTDQGSCRNAMQDPSDYYEKITGDRTLPPDYGVKYSNGRLTVIWYDMNANCAVDFKGGVYKKDDDRLTFYIQEYYTEVLATCTCRYDVVTEFDNILPGVYTLVLGGKEYKFNLNNGTDILIAEGNVLTGVESVPVEAGLFSFSNGLISVNADGDYSCEIFNLEGVRMASVEGIGHDEIDLGTLPSGVYVLRLTINGRTVSTRIRL